MRSKSISIQDYKKQLRKLYKKNHLKFKSTNYEEIPENVSEIEEKLGWHRGDYCKTVTNLSDNIPSGCIGKVYSPYNENKIVIILYKTHKTIKVKPSDIEHYTPKKGVVNEA